MLGTHCFLHHIPGLPAGQALDICFLPVPTPQSKQGSDTQVGGLQLPSLTTTALLDCEAGHVYVYVYVNCKVTYCTSGARPVFSFKEFHMLVCLPVLNHYCMSFKDIFSPSQKHPLGFYMFTVQAIVE